MKLRILEKIKNFDIKKCRVSFKDGIENMNQHGKSLAVTVICGFVVMMVFAFAAFFAVVKTPEQVMVPDVNGKELTTALIEMQLKELYPKIQLRYSNNPNDEGTVLSQTPGAGAIVKAGQRITLTVSRGIVLDKVGDYVGQKYDDVRMNLQSLFAGQTRPLLVMDEPLYKPDTSEPGTILEQDPPAETEISEPIKLKLVVSRGPEYEKTRVPNLIGKSVNDMLLLMQQSKIIFEFESHEASADEKAGRITSQETFETEFIDNYTRMKADFAFAKKSEDENIYGIFEANLTEYPYAVSMTLEAVPQEGPRYTLAHFKHTGGLFTAPYAVPAGTEIVLSVVGKEVKKMAVTK